MAIAVSVLAAREIEGLAAEIVGIYLEAFTRPPYNKPGWEIDGFADSLLKQLGREDYRFVGAFDGGSGQIVGFAYGYASTASPWWYGAVRPALEEARNAGWLEDSFQFVEIAVDPKAQGQGVGSRLHDELLGGIRQKRAVLSTLQADTAAHHLYRGRGWVVLCQDLFFPEVERRYQVMGREAGEA
jgi:ribosomal protein S18 acetylase RimI-like enzyme